LYRWNCQLSATLFEMIGWFEVGWRNAVDHTITSRRPERPHWLFDPNFPLSPPTRAKIAKAITKVHRGGTRHPNSGQVIAELSLGFWRLTTRNYHQTLWTPYLKSAFPHAPNRPDRHDIDRRIQGIILTRNRIAHHEPMFGRVREIRELTNDILQLGAWINPEAVSWWEQQSTLMEVLALRPASSD
jgi:hypothetical protein